MDKVHFFLLCSAIGGLAAVITWAFDRPLRSILESAPAPAVLTAEPEADPHIEPQPGG
jgi:hypothetical protein